MSTESQQANGQAARHAKWRTTSWKPGQSGNPEGTALLKARDQAAKQRQADMSAAIAAEFSGDLSAFESYLADEAARQLIRATLSKNDEMRIKLTRNGLAMVERIRQGRAARQVASPVTAFDQYLKQKAGSP